jgi:hypothetical protein
LDVFVSSFSDEEAESDAETEEESAISNNRL